jgi:hypothetical protein
MDRIAKPFVTVLAIAATALSALACGGDTALQQGGETISRAQFIETYVELRKAGLKSPGTELTLDRQREVLDSLGVTEEELLDFVEYWGTDGEVMLQIWEEVDSIMQEVRRPEDEETEPELEEETGPEGGEGVGSP